MSDPPGEVAQNDRYLTDRKERERNATTARVLRICHRLLTRASILATAGTAITGGFLLYGIEADADSARWLVRQLANSSVKTNPVPLAGPLLRCR